MTAIQLPLPCLICGVHPRPLIPGSETAQPSRALMFSAGSGHYGSTVWDERGSHQTLEIIVCDSCLRAHHARVGVAVHKPLVRPAPEYIAWNPGEDDDDDD